jgi:hypothetical protein
MEFYQTIQSRSGQTVAVVKTFAAGLSASGVDAAGLAAQGAALEALAQQRDHALADYDGANNAERLGLLVLQTLVLALPKAAEAELDDHNDAESALLDLLVAVYAIKPRNTETVLARGRKLASALTRINAYLATLNPPRAEVRSGGKGLADLTAALDAQAALEQALQDRTARLNQARAALRDAAAALDRLNKRFYARLQAEARTDPALAQALAQIDTGAPNLPATLSIKSVLQGGADNLHLLVGYDPGSIDAKADSTLEWQVDGADADFANSAAADPSGNSIGPFAAGSAVKLRTRVRNSNGATTSAVRTLQIA